VTQTQIPAILDSERHLALVERVHRSDLGQRPQNRGSFHLLSRGILWSLCGEACSGFTYPNTGRKVYCCPKNLYPSNPKCGCRRVYAPDADEAVWSTVVTVLRSVDLEAADGDPEEGLNRLVARLTEADIAVGRVAVELVALDLSVPVLRSLTQDLTASLEVLRRETDRIRSVVHHVAFDPAVRAHLRQVAESTRGRLNTLDGPARRAVLDLLDVHVRITRWDTCVGCGGRGRLTGRRGALCHSCTGGGAIPRLHVSGLWTPDD
jgi:hypothetical protein